MISKTTLVIVLVALASCNTFRRKKQFLNKEQYFHYEKLEALRQYIQGIEERKQEETQQQQVTQLEIIADSLLYWHPDSGLYLRPGILKVKYKQEELNSKNQIKSTNEIEAAFTKELKEQQLNNEHQVNTKTIERKVNYWLVAIVVVLLLLAVRLLRKFSQYLSN